MSISVEIDVSQFAAMRGRVANAAATIDAEVGQAVDWTLGFLRANVQVAASGRPGPEVDTNEFRSSWTTAKDGRHAGWVGSNTAYAWRLERGWYGADSLGRVINTRPFPSLEPSVRLVAPDFQRRLKEAFERALT